MTRRSLRDILEAPRRMAGRMAEILPRFMPGKWKTYTTSAPVQAGRLVAATGDRLVAHAADASTRVKGVVHYDAATGEEVPVGRYGTYQLTALGAIAAGDRVCAAADGRARTWVNGVDSPASIVGSTDSAIADGARGNVDINL